MNGFLGANKISISMLIKYKLENENINLKNAYLQRINGARCSCH